MLLARQSLIVKVLLVPMCFSTGYFYPLKPTVLGYVQKTLLCCSLTRVYFAAGGALLTLLPAG